VLLSRWIASGSEINRLRAAGVGNNQFLRTGEFAMQSALALNVIPGIREFDAVVLEELISSWISSVTVIRVFPFQHKSCSAHLHESENPGVFESTSNEIGPSKLQPVRFAPAPLC
jgi:hypothetical protein